MISHKTNVQRHFWQNVGRFPLSVLKIPLFDLNLYTIFVPMKKIALFGLIAVFVMIVANSCAPHKKTLGCPGMITKTTTKSAAHA
jgi:hypothetical protein